MNYFLVLGIGALLPYLVKQIKVLIDYKKYQVANIVYDQIDLDILNRLGGSLIFTETICIAVRQIDPNLSDQEIKKITQLFFENFKFPKAFHREFLHSTLSSIHNAQNRTEETNPSPETENN